MINYEQISTIAVVGLGNNIERPAYRVAKYLIEQGYKVIPVHPKDNDVLGLETYRSVKDIPKEIKIDIVDIFLSPDKIMPIVEDAIERGVEIIWAQLGVINNEAATKAKNAGVTMIMDKCIKIEHANWKAGK